MYGEYRAYVIDHMSSRDLLELLAEESAEQAQAALKLIRAYGLNDNPTPVRADEAYGKLREECGDTLMVMDALGLVEMDTSYNPKWMRWAIRLGYGGETACTES